MVFDAMITSIGLDGWFTDGSEIDLKPGGYNHTQVGWLGCW